MSGRGGGSTVWVDDKEVGTCNSLVAPHEFELGILPVGKHRLTVRLDNRMSVFPGMPSRNAGAPPAPGYRPDGHSVSDALGATWNGIVGRIELRTTSPVYIEDVQVFPDVAKKRAVFQIHIANASGQPGKGKVMEQELPDAGGYTADVEWDAKGGDAILEVPLIGRPQWDEFHPVLQGRTIKLLGTDFKDERMVTFGLREIKGNGRQLLLNGTEINIRATHSGGDFPLTGYPATDVPTWKKIIQTCKDYGLNGIRFHSWCPPEACFTAADELGFYVQPECGMWNNFSVPGMPQMLEAETQRMMRAYGNHPSYVMLSPSNEPAGSYTTLLPQWAGRWYEKDPRRLYAMDTGRAQANAVGPTYYIGVIRGRNGWFGNDYSASLAGVNVPTLAHEVGQWCAYPDFDVIKKFTGYLQPSHYEIYRDSATAKGAIDRNHEFAWASGKFQVQCYKEEIEANLRTPGLAGFQLLDLHDYLGQGGALIGVLDTFWESKGYCTAEEFRRFSGPTVPLARFRTYIATAAGTLTVPVEMAHFGATPLKNATPYWKIADLNGKTAIEGTLPARHIAVGKAHLGEIVADLSKLPAPREYRVVVGLRGEGIAGVENSWSFWVYPSEIKADVAGDILVTNIWADAQAKLAAGGKVLYTPGPNDLGRNSPQMKNVPVFWNRLMNPNSGGDAMLGLWVDAKHPALAGFPTEGFSDWQWIDMVTNVKSININAQPKALRPVVSAIDDWSRNDKLAVIFEAKVGTGKLLVSAVNVLAANRPTVAQLRRSLLDYMAGDKFNPAVELTAAQAAALWTGPNAPPTTPITTQPGFNPGDVIETPPVPPQ